MYKKIFEKGSPGCKTPILNVGTLVSWLCQETRVLEFESYICTHEGLKTFNVFNDKWGQLLNI